MTEIVLQQTLGVGESNSPTTDDGIIPFQSSKCNNIYTKSVPMTILQVTQAMNKGSITGKNATATRPTSWFGHGAE